MQGGFAPHQTMLLFLQRRMAIDSTIESVAEAGYSAVRHLEIPSSCSLEILPSTTSLQGSKASPLPWR
jgi:hypothetical protein